MKCRLNQKAKQYIFRLIRLSICKSMKLENPFISSVNPFVALLISLILLLSCSSKERGNTDQHIRLVKTTRVVKTTSEIIKKYPAVIEEAEEVNLAFRVAGLIQKVLVKEGDFVKKGQLIAQMDTRDYEVQKNAIEIQVQQLQGEYKRIEELNNRKSVADNDYEKMLAGKEMAEAKLKNASDQLKDTKLYAPFSGYITKVNFKAGELVNHGTLIATMVDVSMLKVEILVPASMYILKDKIVKIECTQDNIPNQIFPLEFYSDNVKANFNGLYKFYFYHKPAPHTKLAPGMNVSVHVTISNAHNDMLSIPVNSIFQKDGGSYVWVVKGDSLASRKIETNNQVRDGHFGVTEGLQKDEVIVIGGSNLFSEGETVRLMAPESKTNIGNIL